MKKISLFKNFTQEIGSRTLPEIVEEIRGDHYKKSILKIRELVKSGDEETVSRLKKGLVAFTVSGLFEGGRKMSFLKSYNPFVILDIDKLDMEILPDLILKAKAIPFTKVLFVSPSGRGLKIVVEVNTDKGKHGVAYRQVMNFYKENLKVEIDQSGKDITRLCFMSYDPEAYYNEGSAVFNILNQNYNPASDAIQNDNQEMDQVPGRAPDLSIEEANLSGNYQDAFGVCVMQTNAKLEFKKGNRNNYIYQLGVNCIHAGIPLEVAVNESKKAFDLNKMEIERTIKSAYNWKPDKSAGTSGKTIKTIEELPIKVSSVIPDHIFELLPDLLKKGCGALNDKREKDIYLTSALGVLSGCMPNVIGSYFERWYHPNLFVFIIGPSGCGKGCLMFVKYLGMAYHRELVALNKQKKEDHEKAWKRYEVEYTKFKKGKLEDPPLEPKVPAAESLFYPANSSSAMIIQHLENNTDAGIIFEMEADSLGNVLKQDWGGYSNLLRKAFHHEPISYSRKSNSEFFEIEHPELSVVISGTPNQVTNLIPTAENGLFSRFIFYTISKEDTWRSIVPREGVTDPHLVHEDLSKEILEMIHFLKANSTKFTMTKEQWQVLDDTCEKMFVTTRLDFGEDANSVVKRLGLICFRIAMILSTIRKFEERSKEDETGCTPADFETAISLTKVYWEHALFMFDGLPKDGDDIFRQKRETKMLFFNALPDRFMRKEAYAICPKAGISTRTGARYLRDFLKEGLLYQSAMGKYGEYFKKPVVLE